VKKYLIISVTAVFIFALLFTLSGCGALLTAIIQALLGTKLGFIAIPAIAAAGLEGSQTEELPGMVLLFSNNIPEGYSPLEGATVTIEGITTTVTTDKDGFFRFDDVPVGIRKITVTHPLYTSIQQEVMVTEEGAGARSFTGFKIVPDGPVSLTLFKDIIDVPQANFSFDTYGLDPNSTAFEPSATWSVNSENATIDADGNFHTTVAGTYTVTATSTLDPSVSDTVEITVVEYTIKIYGIVRRTDGNPVSGASVNVDGTTSLTTTDSSGNYTLFWVPALSSVTVTATAPGLEGSQTSSVTDPTQPVEVNITVQNTSQPHGGTPTPVSTKGNVSGIATETDGTSIPAAYLAFYSLISPSESTLTSQGVPYSTSISDPNGFFQFLNVPAGECRIELWRSESDHMADPNNPLGWQEFTLSAGESKTVSIQPYVAEATWKTHTTGTPEELFGLHVIDPNTVWAVGNNDTVLNTVDGGFTWNSTSNSSNTLLSIYFLNPGTGWFTGFNGVIYHTSDGSTWLPQSSGGVSQQLHEVYFTDSGNGWIVGWGGTILHTDNGGSTWSSQPGVTSENLHGMAILSSSEIWVCGWNGTILHTTNGGDNWDVQTITPPENFHRIFFIDSNLGWVVGTNGTIMHTDNGGSTWSPQTSNTGVLLWDIRFLDSDLGWAVGEGGTILRTTNGGNTWLPQDSGTSAALRRIRMLGPNMGWATGTGGTVLEYSL